MRTDVGGIARAVGVTRVARITGLDRAGVEVACAVRPGGHVLQVSNGKGLAFEDAARGAVMEACELWGAEHPPALRLASIEEMRAELRAEAGEGLLPPDALGAEPGPALSSARIGWYEAADLLTGKPVLVPAHALFCPPPDGAPLGPAIVRWTSNGLAAHRDRDAARLHALLEAVERDSLARAFPDGLDPAAIRRRLLRPASLARAAPRAAALAASLRARRFDVHLLDARPDRDAVGLPVAAAILVDRDEGPVPVAAGYACRLGRDDALVAALLEAAQSRLTEIHGAREDVATSAAGREAALPIAAACARTRARREPRALPDLRARPPRVAVRLLLARLRRAGFAQALAADLPSPRGVHVVKALVPGLLLSELL